MRGRPASGEELILAMSVHNIGFLLDRLGEDCHPLQFLRELTQNSIEAIQQLPGKQGEIVWDVDWNRYDLTGIYKLACIDTGIGMMGEESFDGGVIVAVNSHRKWRIAILLRNKIRIGATVQESFKSVEIAPAQCVENDRITRRTGDVRVRFEASKDCDGVRLMIADGDIKS